MIGIRDLKLKKLDIVFVFRKYGYSWGKEINLVIKRVMRVVCVCVVEVFDGGYILV